MDDDVSLSPNFFIKQYGDSRGNKKTPAYVIKQGLGKYKIGLINVRYVFLERKKLDTRSWLGHIPVTAAKMRATAGTYRSQ